MLHIITPYGNHYKVNAQGQIIREHWDKNGTFLPPSEGWKFLGIQPVRNTYGYIPFKQITPEFLKTLDVLYKNGNPKYTVVDLDHGTTRVWGNTKVHGIKHIYFE